MSYEPAEVFVKVDELLSDKPALHLREVAHETGCSYPFVERSILKYAFTSFRLYQKKKKIERAIMLLKQGLSRKVIAMELGYRWPEHLSRFVRKAVGCSLEELRTMSARVNSASEIRQAANDLVTRKHSCPN